MTESTGSGHTGQESRPAHIGVRDEHAPTFGRQNLTLWSGPFCSVYEGSARELPNHNGFMVAVEYGPTIRVECGAPRADDNYAQVDTAIRDAIEQAEREAATRAATGEQPA